MRKFGIYAILLTTGLILFGKAVIATNQDNFWSEAARGGMAEVRLGNLALQKSQNEEVRRFAQMMVDEHTASNNELMQLAAGKNVTLPTDLDRRHSGMMTKLNNLSGANFDREYMKSQVSDHEKMIKLFRKQSERGTDADAKAFAAKNLPNLQSHLQMARTVYNGVRRSSRGGNMNSGGNANSDSGMNMNSDTNSNMNMNGNRNSNVNRGNRSNRNSDTNRNMNMNANSNRNSNTESNRNSNSNVNNF